MLIHSFIHEDKNFLQVDDNFYTFEFDGQVPFNFRNEAGKVVARNIKGIKKVSGIVDKSAEAKQLGKAITAIDDIHYGKEMKEVVYCDKAGWERYGSYVNHNSSVPHLERIWIKL